MTDLNSRESLLALDKIRRDHDAMREERDRYLKALELVDGWLARAEGTAERYIQIGCDSPGAETIRAAIAGPDALPTCPGEGCPYGGMSADVHEYTHAYWRVKAFLRHRETVENR